MKTSRFKGSGAKSAGRSNKKMGGNKDIAKLLQVEKKDAEKRLKKAIEKLETKLTTKI